MAIDKITTASITDGTITSSDLASGAVPNQSAFKNIIINGDMSISQRSTSVSSITGSGYNTVDRFRTNMGTAGTWTQSQSTDVPTGQGFATSLKMDCTTANGSLSAGSFLIIDQRVEGQNLQYLKKGTSSAESTTMSFWVKSAKTGTYVVVLADMDNTRAISKSYTISSANTWEKKTVTFPGDTTGAFGNDNAASLKVQFWLVAGTTYSSGTLQTSWGTTTNANYAVGQVNLADSTSNDWYVTGVQLEAGTSASDFEFLPVDVNLQRCFRYYYKKISTDNYGPLAQGMQIGGTDCMIQGYHPIKMRSSPSLAISGTWSVESGTTNATFSLSGNRTNLFGWSNQQSISATDGSAAIIYAGNDGSASFSGDAEL